MERQKPGRKPLPPEVKKIMVAAYVTRQEKELIINTYGSLAAAIKQQILSQFYLNNGHSNSIGDRQPVDGQ